MAVLGMKATPGVVRDWDHLLRLDHVLDLTDCTGIIQHATGAVPNWSTGYCVDDVARQALVGAGSWQRRPTPEARRLVLLGLAYLDFALADEQADPQWTGRRAGMRNFMSYDRHWLDEPHLGDHVGRTVWALGEVLVRMGEDQSLSGPAHRLQHRLLPLVARFDSLHEWVYAAVGLSMTAECPQCREGLEGCVAQLDRAWDQHAHDGWPWPEPVLTYDNPRTPQALLLAGETLRRDDLVDMGRRALDFFRGLSRGRDGELATVGNQWFEKGDELPDFSGDEQPIDAGAMVECLVDAARVLGRDELLDEASDAFCWFLGRNRLGLPVYDDLTAGCHDGLGEEALNDNMGAESTLAAVQAALALERTGRPAPTV